MGLKDIAAMAQVLAEARMRGEDIGDVGVLRRFETWRRFETQSMGWATEALNRLFSNDNAMLRSLRDAGLAAVNQAPFLRKTLMRRAAGLGEEQPKLLRGRALF